MTILLVFISSYAGLLFLAILAELRHHVKSFPRKEINPVPINLSVIVPFRNESENLPSLIASIQNQECVKASVEFIFVDDHSEDGGMQIIPDAVLDFTISKYSLKEHAGKKAAVSFAREKAKSEWIVCIDADVVLSGKWLKEVVAAVHVNHDAGMLVLPVTMKSSNFWGHFFAWEFVLLRELAVIFFNRPLMANAANLIIHAPTWNELLGKVKGTHLASGDDVFLLQAFSRQKLRKVVCPTWNVNLCVATEAPNTFLGGIQQRVRWLKKPVMFRESFKLGVIALSFWIGNFIWLSGIFLLLNFSDTLLSQLIGIALIPVMVVLWSIVSSIRFREQKLLFGLPLILLIYPFYAFLLPFIAFCIHPTWKGRKI